MENRKRFAIGAAVATVVVLGTAAFVYPSVEKHMSYAPVIEHSVTGGVLADRIGDSVSTVGVATPTEVGSLTALDKTLLVKYTLADAAAIDPDETIDSLWAAPIEEVETKAYGQYSANAIMYKASGIDGYYIAFIDATTENGAVSGKPAIDWCVAWNDGNGHVIEGAFYDAESGIVYIPCDAFDEANDAVGVQVQLLKAIDLADTAENVQVKVFNARDGFVPAIEEGVFELDSIEPALQIPVAADGYEGAIGKEDIELFANDMYVPLTDDNSAYDSESGILTVNINGMGVTDVEVKINKQSSGLLDGVVDSQKAYGYTLYDSDIDFYNDGDTYFDMIQPDQTWVGKSFEYEAEMKYRQGVTSWSGDYGMSTGLAGPVTGDMTEDIAEGSWSQAASSSAPWYEVGTSPARMMVMEGIFDKTVRTGGVTYNFHVVGRYTDVLLECSHVDSPAGYHGYNPPGEWFEDTAFMRVLKVVENGDWSYMIVGFISPTTNAQTCSAIYKIRFKGGLKIEMRKASNGNNALGVTVNSGVSATFGVYTDPECTNEIKTIITGSNGYGSVTVPDPGTYYLKEKSATWPHYVNPLSNAVFEVSGSRGQTVGASARNDTYAQLEIVKHKLPPNGLLSVDDIAIGGNGRADVAAEIANNRNIHYTITVRGDADAGDIVCTLPNKVVYEGNVSGATVSSDHKQITVSGNTSDKVVSFDATMPEGWDASTSGIASLLDISTDRMSLSLTTAVLEDSLAGAKYTIYSDPECNNVIATITTDADGKARYGYDNGQILVPGTTYYVKEVQPPRNYDLNTEVYEFTASADPTHMETQLSVGDSWHSLRIEKRSQFPDYTRGRSDFSLEGAEYDVWYNVEPRFAEDFPPNFTSTTDALGNILIPRADAGFYWIKEKTASAGYTVSDEWYYAEVDENAQTVVRVAEWIPVTIEIMKKSASTVPDIEIYSLEGAVFELYGSEEDARDGSNPLFEQMVTDADGKTGKQTVPMGDYWIKEVQPPAGYKLNNEVFHISADQFAAKIDQYVTVFDEPTELTVVPSKTASDETRAVDIFSSLEGAEIAVYSTYDDAVHQTNEVARRTTNAEGTCEPVTGLDPKKQYFVREVVAPPAYQLNPNIITVDFTDSLTESAVVEDTGRPLKIKVVKQVSGTTEDVPDLSGAEFGIYTSEADALNRENNYVARVMTDSSGECPTVENLPARRYWISELTPPAGYYLTYEAVEASFDANTFEAHVVVDEEPIKIKIKIAKRSASEYATPTVNPSMFSYENAVFGIYKTYNEALSATNAAQGDPIAIVTTDANGDIEYTAFMEPGTYYIKELVPPNGYLLAPGVYSVEAVKIEEDDTNSVPGPSHAPGMSAAPKRVMMTADAFEAADLDAEIVFEDGDVVVVDLPQDSEVAESPIFGISGAEQCESNHVLNTDMEVLVEDSDIPAGDRVKIAVIDTGAEKDVVDEHVTVLEDGVFGDCNGHGTNMARVIRNANPDAYIISIRAFDASGHATAESVYTAINYAIEAGADVINMSFAGYAPDGCAAIDKILDRARGEGIALIASAGNYGEDASDYAPANSGAVVAVGALDADGSARAESNYGDTVRIWEKAPNTSVAAAIASGKAARDVDGFNEEYPVVVKVSASGPEDVSFVVQTPEEKEYTYKGYAETFTAPYDGYYTFEVWGAQGGHNAGANGTEFHDGGKGGYASGTVYLTRNTTVYVCVGDQGANAGSENGGWPGATGYNGGGDGNFRTNDPVHWAGQGGGATHIAKNDGTLREIGTTSNLYLVAGGGGGAAYWQDGGSGGGQSGNNGGGGAGYIGIGGDQYQGGSVPVQSSGESYVVAPGFGYGGNAGYIATGSNGQQRAWAGGGGGGLYGGSAGAWSSTDSSLYYAGGGGGGSGYIGGVENGTWSNGVRSGAGLAKITYDPTQTVTFDANGGTGTMEDQIFDMNAPQALTSKPSSMKLESTIAYDYHNGTGSPASVTQEHPFSGWAKSADGVLAYTDGQTVTNPGGNEMGVTQPLYAKWGDASVTLPSPTRTGYIFEGWYTEETGGTRVGGAGDTYAFAAGEAPATLHARWTEDLYTIHFNGSDATSGSMPDQVMQNGIASNLDANAFVKDGCEFMGWSLTRPAAGVRVPHIDYVDGQSVTSMETTNNEVTLYAVWKSTEVIPQDATVVYDTPDTTSIRIIKQIDGDLPAGADIQGDWSLAGAVFGIYETEAEANSAGPNDHGNPVAEVTTDESGIALWTDAEVGHSYWVKELAAPANGKYELNENTFPTGAIVAQAATDVLVPEDITPIEQPSVIKITKLIGQGRAPMNTDSGTWSVEGAVFGVYTSRTAAETVGSTPYARMTIGADGTASLSVEQGTYYLRELSAPAGLEVSDAITEVQANSSAEVPISISDTPTMIQISITKANASPGTTAGAETAYSLADATFGVYKSAADAQSESNAVVTLTTDSDGKASVDGLFPASYYVKELSAPANFVKSDVIYPVAADTTVPQELTVPNQPQVVFVKVIKSADCDLTAYPSLSLRGAKFGVYSDQACTTLVDTLITDASGNAQSKALPPAQYWVKEIEAPAGLALNATVTEADLRNTAEKTVEITDDVLRGRLSLTKTSNHPDWVDTLGGATFGIYRDAACTDKVEEMTTAADGTATSSELLAGRYYVKEITPLENHAVVDTVYPVDVENGQTKVVNDGNPIINETTSIMIFKSAAGGAQSRYSLEGAVYGVYSTPDCSGQQVGSIRTAPDGSGELHPVAPGTYYIKEIDAPFGYDIDDRVYSVTAGGSTSVTLAVVDREKILAPMTMRIIKYNDENGSVSNGTISVEGAEFTVRFYPDTLTLDEAEAGTPDRTWVLRTDANGIASLDEEHKISGDDFFMFEDQIGLMDGTVLITESKAPTGYEPNDGKWLYHVSDGQVTGIDGEQVVSFTVNVAETPKRANVRFAKTDEDGTPMANMPFMISLMNGNEVVEQHLVFTDSNGVYDSSTTTSSSFVNANDYLVESGKVPSAENRVDNSRLWFAGQPEILSDPPVGRGALVFGTYKVEELETSSNTRYELPDPVTFTVDAEHTGTIDIGTFVNTEVKITSTTATDSTTNSHSGSTSSEKIVDVVTYEGLVPGKTYTFIGGAYDVETGETIVRDDDTGLSCIVELTATQSSGTLTMEYPLAGFNAAGKDVGISVVVTRDHNTKAEHNVDLSLASQKVSYPGIRTTATDSNGTHQGFAGDTITINDEIAYENLDPSRTYTLRGTLHKIDRGTWYSGTAITGTSASAAAFPSSGVAAARAGDLYLNTDTGDVYCCTAGGNATTATWVFVDNVVPARTPATATWYTGTAISHAAGLEAPDTGIANPVEGDLYLNERTGAVYVCHTKIVENVVVSVFWERSDKTAPAAIVDAGVVQSSGGVNVTAEKTFTPGAADGSESMIFTFDNNKCNIGSVVVFEELYDADGVLVSSHADVFDEGQTVSYPYASTVARDAVTSTHQGVYTSDMASIVDTVAYENLTPGVTYTLSGSLMDANTAAAIGSPAITATTTFTPTTPNGTVEMTFNNIPKAAVTGKTVVVYERVYDGSNLIAEHADQTDTNQYVVYPGVGTVAVDAASGQHVGFAGSDPINIIDTVHYSGLTPGTEYTVTGTAMNKATNQPLKNTSNQDAVVTKTFIPETSEGDVAIQFSLPASQSAFTAVVFEEITLGSSIVAEHKDINDESQSVHYPTIGTTATDNDTQDHEGANDGVITITDVVAYTNLVAGQSYTMTGTLIDKATGAAVKDDSNNEVTASTTFTPDAANGTVNVVFTFNKTTTENLTYVAYETLYSASSKIAEHNDLTDEQQSVFFPKIRTTATDKDTQDHVGSIEANGKTTLVDVVAYDNLIVGHEYTITGKLMDGATGQVLKNGNTEITATKTFTAASVSGTETLEFTFDRSLVDSGKHVVAFEYLIRNGYEIATHTDLTDENQTVWYPHISTTAKDKDLNIKVGKTDGTITVTDAVAYDNLVPGVSYTLTATLWSKADGSLLMDGNTPVSGTKTFTPENATGTVDVDITFPATLLPQGGILVAYEEMTHVDKPVAEHKNPDDEDQTVYYPVIGTTAVDGTTAAHTGFAGAETITITDTISYSNLLPGVEYSIETSLHDKSGGTVIASTVAASDLTFTPQSASGTVDVHITAAAADVAGKSVVVFEKVKIGTNEVAVHEDLSDTEQTVSYPKIGTTAVDSVTNTHEGLSSGTVTIKDTVAYENLPAGDYVLVAYLHDAATGQRLKNGSADITARLEFTADGTNGTKVMELSAPAAVVDGKATVVFEELYDASDHLIAEHKDQNDAGQTVVYPHVHTTALATDLVNGGAAGNTVAANRRIKLEDTITFRNLDPQTTYQVVSTVVVKDSGTAFKDAQNRTIEKTSTFTPTATDGTYTVTFPEIDAYNMVDVEIVVFEKVYNGSTLVAQHADINDAAQTVKFTAASDIADLPIAGSPTLWIMQMCGTIVVALAILTAVRVARRKRITK